VLDLVGRLGARSREDDPVRASAVLALGHVGDADADPLDRLVRETLAGLVRKGEPYERRFATIALALVGSRPGTGDDPLSAAREVERVLVAHLQRARSRERAWAGLALGLYGQRLRECDRLVEGRTADLLLDHLQGARTPGDSAAFALAVGLVGDRRGTDAAERRFTRTGEELPRSQIALALGMLGDPRARGFLAAETASCGSHPERFEWAAVGRALLDDPTVRPALVERLLASDVGAEVEGCARALAWTGSVEHVAPLLERFDARGTTASARGQIARALGWILDTRGEPWIDPLVPALNYSVPTDSLTNPQGTGILDLL
jgi:HEAT repeat protein